MNFGPHLISNNNSPNMDCYSLNQEFIWIFQHAKSGLTGPGLHIEVKWEKKETKELNHLLHDCYTGAPASKCGGNVPVSFFGFKNMDSNFSKKISTNQSRRSAYPALIGWKIDIPRNFALIGWKIWQMLYVKWW